MNTFWMWFVRPFAEFAAAMAVVAAIAAVALLLFGAVVLYAKVQRWRGK